MTQAPQAPEAPQVPTGAAPVKPHRGGMILAFGIIGLVCCIIFAILAWVMGNKDLKEMAAGTMDRSGEGMTKAGKIIGMIACILAIVGLIIQLIMLAVGAGTMWSST
jgi:ABC-type Fe3+ transport system permease subunit